MLEVKIVLITSLIIAAVFGNLFLLSELVLKLSKKSEVEK